MSLTSFLNNKDVKERFRQEFAKPKLGEKKELLAPPRSKRLSLVGTAFDYLLRFRLQRLNPEAIRQQWVAKEAILRLSIGNINGATYDIDTGTIEGTNDPLVDKAERYFNDAWIEHERYIGTGKLTDSLIRSTLRLAQLDTYYRSGYIDENFGRTYKADIDDLRQLLDLVNLEQFRAERLCMLNPTFGDASRLVSGADADLLIDDTLIDIKTTRRFELRREYFDQLMGYYTLYKLGGIGGLTPIPEITKVAIYFARYSYLRVFELKDIIQVATFPDFIQWFAARAKARRPLNG